MISAEKLETHKPDKGNFAERNGAFWAMGRVIPAIPPGEYDTVVDRDSNMGLRPQSHVTDDLLDIPIPEMKMIVRDMDRFMASGERYRNAGLVHKRGYLLYGPPGTGKTCLVARLAKRTIEAGGLVIHTGQMGLGMGVELIKAQDFGRQTMFVMEEIDEWKWGNTDALQILDGAASPPNAVFVATTNFIDKVPDRVRNRPGRFDRVIQIGFPPEEARRSYVDHMITRLKVDPVPAKATVQRMLKLTHERSLAHLKEMIIAVTVMDDTPEEAATRFGIAVGPAPGSPFRPEDDDDWDLDGDDWDLDGDEPDIKAV